MFEKPQFAISPTSCVKLAVLCTALVALSLVQAQNASASNQQAAANFIQADGNGDGALTPGEFKTFIDLNATHGIGRSQMVRDRNMYGRAFGRLDTNGDGKITAAELQSAGR